MKTTISKTGKYQFTAEAVHCDIQQKLFISTLCHHILRAADLHSTERKFGMSYLKTINKTWVLSRFALEIFQMPKAYDEFSIETWVENVMKYFTARNFSILNPLEQTLAYCRSIWSMIDTETRHPIDLFSVRNGEIANYITSEKKCPIAGFANWKPNNHTKPTKQIQILYSDCDSNGHLNSVKYIDHVLDLWDIDFHKTFHVYRLEIAYQAECYFGDTLLIYREEIPTKDANTKEFRIQICKLLASEKTEMEVSKIKICFTKQ